MGVFKYFKENEAKFYGYQFYISIAFFVAYSFHLFLIINSFRTIGSNERSLFEISYNSKHWLGSKFEFFFRHVIVIAALCVSGHISEVLINVANIFVPMFNPGFEMHHLNPEKNFTLFAYTLSWIIIAYDILGIFSDFVFPWDLESFKKAISLNWPDDSKNRSIFKFLPIRPIYFSIDIIALIFWRNYFKAVWYTQDFDFVEVLSFFIIIYVLLIFYRMIGYFKKFE
jgi:hypothetical protein